MVQNRVKYPLTDRAKEVARFIAENWEKGLIEQNSYLLEKRTTINGQNVLLYHFEKLPDFEFRLYTIQELSLFGLVTFLDKRNILLLQELKNAVENDFYQTDTGSQEIANSNSNSAKTPLHVLNDLIEQTETWTTMNIKQRDLVKQRATMAVRRYFGDASHHLIDLQNIFRSVTVTPHVDPDKRSDIDKYNFAQQQYKILNILSAIREDMTLASPTQNTLSEQVRVSSRIFIVHGHDEAMKQSVARFIEKIGLEAIILHEQANAGMTIIEKFENYADVGYAIVLLSPDDMAYHQTETPDDAKPRARQNVVFELGFFIGRLGRDRTFALMKDNVEIPSDISGVVYTPYDGADGAWRTKLVRELKALGYDIDANALF